MSSVNWGLKLATIIGNWVLSEDGMRSWQRKRLMRSRDLRAQELLKNAQNENTPEAWAALRDFTAESVRLSNEP